MKTELYNKKVIKPIRSEQDYKEALEYIDRFWDVKPNTKESDILEVLVTLVEKYEEEHFKIDEPDPIEAIKFIMEQRNLSNKDLIPIMGSSGRVSEVLWKKRKLSLSMIRKLHNEFHIPYEVLAADYRLSSSREKY